MALLDRVAGAPISWGICEVPGWGVQLPVERVLSEMSEIGLTHTELGALGWLPGDVESLNQVLELHGLALLGGFVPLTLHDPVQAEATRAAAHEAATLLAGAGARFFVTAVTPSPEEFHHIDLDEVEWAHLCEMLAEIEDLVAGYGLDQVVHPHVDTVIERADEVQRLLADTTVQICLDTAHLAIGGTDIVDLVRSHGRRVGLVHLKDVDMAVAEDLGSGGLSLMEAVQRGVFLPLGRGGLPIAEIVDSLERSRTDLWYVLEQDTAITDGDPSATAGPKVDVCESIDFLRSLDPVSTASGGGTGTPTQEG
jgi:inosose dehydratase